MFAIAHSYLLAGLLLMLPLLSTALAAEPSAPASNLVVFSISPSQAEPGSSITINGSGFRDDTSVWLGGSQLNSRLIAPTRLEATIPLQTSPGQYALAIRSAKVTRTYGLQVLSLRPTATSLTPDRITICSNEPQELTVQGSHFTPDSQLLLDGAIIRSRFNSPESISFSIPAPLSGGLHQVTVKRGDHTTTPLALAVLTAPEIHTVTSGESQLNSYQLLISGINFTPQSSLLVDGAPLAAAGLQQRDRLLYLDCTRLIYQRQPVTSSPRPLRLQVINPNSEYSDAYEITAP